VPLFQYFGWVGGFLLAALFAASWCICAPVTPAPRSGLPLNQRINIRIHTDHKWSEGVVFDTTRSPHEANAEPETDIGEKQTDPSGTPAFRRARGDRGYRAQAVFSTALLRRSGCGAGSL
jgi:hypothetical protein